MKLILKQSLILSILSSILGGCFSKTFDEHPLHLKPTKKKLLKSPDGSQVGSSSQVLDPYGEKKIELDYKKIVKLYHRWNHFTYQMKIKDFEILEQLRTFQPSDDFTQATLILGFLQSYREKVKSQVPSFEEADIKINNLAEKQTNQDQEQEQNGLSAESYLLEQGINLPQVIHENQFLNNLNSHLLAQASIETGSPSSEEFVHEVQEAIRTKVQSARDKQILTYLPFSDLIASIPLQNETSTMPSGYPQDVQNPTGANMVSSPLPFGEEVFENEEHMLQEADNFIKQTEYLKAIEILARISEDSIYIATAKEKIKEASNYAVKDLRQLAARAFQSAKPLSDKKARENYLKEAQGFLQEAIDRYPMADQIPTVKQNLNVINNSLKLMAANEADSIEE